MSARELIEFYELIPHPEGGYFRETYRAAGVIPGTLRNFSTAILYLLARGDRSKLHRLSADEVWHFHLGGPLLIHQIFPDGALSVVTLGPDSAAGQRVQHVVPAGCWFGAIPAPDSEFSLVGCTVAPGFDFRDFELGARDDLLAKFPSAAEVIRALT